MNYFLLYRKNKMSKKYKNNGASWWIVNGIDKRKHGMPITITTRYYPNVEFIKIDDRLNKIYTSVYRNLTLSSIYVSKYNIQEKQVVFHIDGNISVS